MSLAPYILRQRWRADPLAVFDPTDPQRELFENVARRLEVYWHSSNKGAKTKGGAALATALARGVTSLGGVRLPKLRSPNTGWLIVPGYKQSLDSALAALRETIGDHPHHEAKIAGSLGYVGMIYVKPDNSAADDFAHWSKIVVQVDQGTAPTGGRIDWAWADEPPSANMWREVRNRGRAREPFLRFITATPLDRRFWEWLLKDFEDCLRNPVEGRYRMQSSIYDNKHLTADDIREAEEITRNDPHRRARLFGDHVDASGDFPWPAVYDVLDRWEARCVEPEIETLVVQQPKQLGNDRFVAEVAIPIQVWAGYDDLDVYYVLADLASGVKSDARERDPLGLHVWSRRHRKLVARFGGYVGPQGLGWAAAELSARYGQAAIDFENNAGWGDPFLSGVADWKKKHPARRCGVFEKERYQDRPGHWSERLGWTTNEEMRSKIISAVEQALLTDSPGVYSREVVGCLRHCIIDEKGKILAGPGYNDEDLILTGRAFHKLATRTPQPVAVKREATSVETFREAVNTAFGRNVMERHPKRPRKSPALKW